MSHLVWLLLLVGSLSLGCATREPRVELVDLQRELDLHIDQYYGQVTGLCTELAAKRQAGTSPVDCTIQGAAMEVSLPSRAYQNHHHENLSRMFHHWCSAYGSKTGQTGLWIQNLREEKVRQINRCGGKL